MYSPQSLLSHRTHSWFTALTLDSPHSLLSHRTYSWVTALTLESPLWLCVTWTQLEWLNCQNYSVMSYLQRSQIDTICCSKCLTEKGTITSAVGVLCKWHWQFLGQTWLIYRVAFHSTSTHEICTMHVSINWACQVFFLLFYRHCRLWIDIDKDIFLHSNFSKFEKNLRRQSTFTILSNLKLITNEVSVL